MSISRAVRQAITSALDGLARQGEFGPEGPTLIAQVPGWQVERPKRPEHGDLSTNVALVLAKPLKRSPREVAESLARTLSGTRTIQTAEVAGPGFINVRLQPVVFREAAREVFEAGPGWGRAASATGERIHLEFVSANPVGPINVASGRNAILGDSIGRLLEAAGHRVTREYYVNDFGNQVRIFAESVAALAEGRNVPEEGYQGEYVRELAEYLKKNDPGILKGDRSDLGRTCVTWMLRGIEGSKSLVGIKRSLADLDVRHDVWFSEESLHRSGAVGLALKTLENRGYLTRKDGALFFVAKDAKEEKDQDKDRVVQKSDGNYTYFASDIAYHADKIERGYDRLLTVLGADHHGYVARVRNSIEALGLPKERYEAVLYQFVFIYKGGALVKSSKRAGNFVTIEEVAEEVDALAGRRGAGKDALRFFFLSRNANTNVDFDIELATKRSLDNPVFYVQYGHARLCSILRRAEEIGIPIPETLSEAQWNALSLPDEFAVAHRLAEFSEVVREAADAREPHRIVFYVQELAREFQSYFTRRKSDPILPPESVRSEEDWQVRWDMDKTQARLAWVLAIRHVYRTALEILGVSAPERMDLPEGEVTA